MLRQWASISDSDRAVFLKDLRGVAIARLEKLARKMIYRDGPLGLPPGQYDLGPLDVIDATLKRQLMRLWNLDDNDQGIEFYGAARMPILEAAALKSSSKPSSTERQALELLRACIYVQEQGLSDTIKDVIILSYRGLDDDAIGHGDRFTGSKPGRGGTVRKAVRGILAASPSSTALEVWNALLLKTPKNMFLRDSPALGKYIEVESKKTSKRPASMKSTAYGRFANLVAEERKAARLLAEAKVK